ncbi:hypothetical protein [Alicyclobacillus sp. SO9]|uniref:hypothetical protein n=1 Tax=Alicyclobacillus sp. SO9 TaxID=2665646 RepID=UPI0018E7FD4F|nr:hypothetical protein [Alicyclobacillus sp. SO9]QQE77259.1 hypothetical protein GI364_14965 [Alicyclobacillus sp. SO9]
MNQFEVLLKVRLETMLKAELWSIAALLGGFIYLNLPFIGRSFVEGDNFTVKITNWAPVIILIVAFILYFTRLSMLSKNRKNVLFYPLVYLANLFGLWIVLVLLSQNHLAFYSHYYDWFLFDVLAILLLQVVSVFVGSLLGVLFPD